MLEGKTFETECRRECEKHIKGYVDDVCKALGISWKWNMENTVFIAIIRTKRYRYFKEGQIAEVHTIATYDKKLSKAYRQ